MNKIFLLGNLGKSPELRYTPQGKAVSTFSLAVNEGSGDNQKTLWVDIVTWEKTAENCANHLNKGSKVLVEGKLSIRGWEDKDGGKHKKTEVVASFVQFLDRGEKGQAQSDNTSEIDLNDLPV